MGYNLAPDAACVRKCRILGELNASNAKCVPDNRNPPVCRFGGFVITHERSNLLRHVTFQTANERHCGRVRFDVVDNEEIHRAGGIRGLADVNDISGGSASLGWRIVRARLSPKIDMLLTGRPFASPLARLHRSFVQLLK
jgi:hypothetical protein